MNYIIQLSSISIDVQGGYLKLFNFSLNVQPVTKFINVEFWNNNNNKIPSIKLRLKIANNFNDCNIDVFQYGNINNIDNEKNTIIIAKDSNNEYGLYTKLSPSLLFIYLDSDVYYQIYNLPIENTDFGVKNDTKNLEDFLEYKSFNLLDYTLYKKYNKGFYYTAQNKECFLPLFLNASSITDENIPNEFQLFIFDTKTKKIKHKFNNLWYDCMGNDSELKTYGTFANKPTENVPISFSYFCTDKKTEESKSNGIMIYYKGNNIWVDALGRVVE